MTKNKGFIHAMSWIFGILFIFSGIINFSNIVSAVLIILAGVILLPATNDFIEDKLNFKLRGWRKFFLVLIIFMASSLLNIPSNNYAPSNNVNSKDVQNSPEFINEDLYEILYKFTNPQSSMTDLQKKEEWKKYKGKYVKSSAIIDSVDKNFFGKYVVLASELPKGQFDIGSDYAIFFKDSQKDKLLKLSKGDRIYFSGRLADYHTTFENLDIKDAVLTSSTTNVDQFTSDSELTAEQACDQIREAIWKNVQQIEGVELSCEIENKVVCKCVTKKGDDEIIAIANLQTGESEIINNDGSKQVVSWKESNFRWEYYERDGAQLYFTVDEYLSPFSRTNGDAVIVKGGSTRYGYDEDNTLKLRACSSTPDTIDYCISSIGLKNRGYSDVIVDIYVPIDAQWDLGLQGSHPISYIKEQTEAKKVLKFTEYIPPIDDYGFVDMKYVDSSWCYVQTDETEYGDHKPKCEKIVDELRVKAIKN